VHEPGDRTEFARLHREGIEPNALHNNCSGKHAGMLATCVAKGWPTESYLESEHPLQRWIHELMSEYTGMPVDRIVTAIDGCSLPTFYLPLATIATALARFVDDARTSEHPASRIMRAVNAHPEMIYEHGGFDTEVIRAFGGRAIAKRGAMAIFVIGVDSAQHGPIGIAVKLEDGNIVHMPPVVLRLLEQLELLSRDEYEQLRPFGTMVLENHNRIRVGEVTAEFNIEHYADAAPR
jgi:L-asparaginase II